MALAPLEARNLRLECPLGPDVLQLVGFTAREEISELYRFELVCVSPVPDLSPADLFGQAVRVTITSTAGDRYFHGVVDVVEQLETSLELTHYRIEIVPPAHVLTFVTDCRIFQEKSVSEIVQEILRDEMDGAPMECSVADAGTRVREYCVQYRETTYDFISRLMEEEGMYFYFQHTEDEVKMYAGEVDDLECPGQPTASYDPDERLPADQERITRLVQRHQVQPNRVVFRAYDFESPSEDPTVERSGEGDPIGQIYDYTGHYARRSDGAHYAKVRLEERQAEAVILTGASDCRAFMAGHHFDLQDHPRSEFNQTLRLTSVRHEAREAPEYESGENAQFHYRNEFVAMPQSTPFRPKQKTRKPRIHGCQPARVTAPAGESIHTDGFARVKVKFYWDRIASDDDTASCWIRCSQARAGSGWGDVSLPHVGHEVLVSFEDGDPDRPVIIGRVYNGDNRPPGDLPATRTQTVSTDQSGNECVVEGDEASLSHVLSTPEGSTSVSIGATAEGWSGVNWGTTGDWKAAITGAWEATIDGTKIETVAGNFEIKGGADWQSVFVGAKHETHLGVKSELVAGWANSIFGGFKTEFAGGYGVSNFSGSFLHKDPSKVDDTSGAEVNKAGSKLEKVKGVSKEKAATKKVEVTTLKEEVTTCTVVASSSMKSKAASVKVQASGASEIKASKHTVKAAMKVTKTVKVSTVMKITV
ncbi:MAG: type VI secretion system Vgr family protein [Planctomycetota bacterium]|jgi:type VI secretion system secreted protein VgrG